VLAITIYGNDEISCGNSYSTLYEGVDSTVRGSAHGARPTIAHQCSVPSSVSDQPKDYIEESSTRWLLVCSGKNDPPEARIHSALTSHHCTPTMASL
jgi:hypothetical protein